MSGRPVLRYPPETAIPLSLPGRKKQLAPESGPG